MFILSLFIFSTYLLFFHFHTLVVRQGSGRGEKHNGQFVNPLVGLLERERERERERIQGCTCFGHSLFSWQLTGERKRREREILKLYHSAVSTFSTLFGLPFYEHQFYGSICRLYGFICRATVPLWLEANFQLQTHKCVCIGLYIYTCVVRVIYICSSIIKSTQMLCSTQKHTS